MSRVLVLGDDIADYYKFYTATRLCPEGPVPVLVQSGPDQMSDGGAGLVAQQLRMLNVTTNYLFGSASHKTRIFADDRLMLRIDKDGFDKTSPEDYRGEITAALSNPLDAIIVSDYDKGAFTRELAAWLIRETNHKNIPVFVDAKNTWNYYSGCFAVFPNKSEAGEGLQFIADHVIQKLGADGCAVDGVHFPTKSHAVRDVCGAGDVFLAAFVYKWLETKELESAAQFANKVAGISVEFVGTKVVSKEEIGI